MKYMKKGTLILFCMGGVYCLIFVLSLEDIITLSPRALCGISIFAGCVALGDLIESISNSLIRFYLNDKKKISDKISLSKILKAITEYISVTLYFIGMLFFIVIPLLEIKDNSPNMNVISNSFAVLSFAIIFLNIAYRDFDDTILKKQKADEELEDEE